MHFTDPIEVFWFYWTWPEVPNLHQSGSISHSCEALLYPLSLQRHHCLEDPSLTALMVGMYVWSCHQS